MRTSLCLAVGRVVWLLFLLGTLRVWAAGNEPVSPLPVDASNQPTSDYFQDERSFMNQEDAARHRRMLPAAVVAGGYHPAAAAFVSAPLATEAFDSDGNRVNQAATAIDYALMGCAADDTAWVIISSQTADTLGNFHRVVGTDYFVDCTAATRPALPSASAWLLEVPIAAGVVQAPRDLASRVVAPGQPHTVSTTTTVDSQAFWQIPPGGRITVAAGHTLTFESCPDAGRWQIFEADAVTTGTVRFGAETCSVIYPEWFGVRADGTTDNLVPLKASIQAAQGIPISLPTGTIAYNSRIEVSGVDVRLHGQGPGKTILDATAVSSGRALQILGGLAAATTLNGDVLRGELTLTVTDASGITARDWIYLDGATLSQEWNANAVTPAVIHYKGEFAKVDSISGNVLTLAHRLEDSYLNTTVVRLLAPVAVELRDLELVGDASIKAVRIENALHPMVDNVFIHGFRESALDFTNVIEGNINRYRAADANVSGTGTSYGFVGVRLHDFTMTNSHLTAGRHAFTVGLGAGATGINSGVNRYMRVTNNYFGGEHSVSTAAFDLHTNAEYLTLADNHIIGIGMGGGKHHIHHNVIHNVQATGSGANVVGALIVLRNDSGTPFLDYVIEHNIFTMSGDFTVAAGVRPFVFSTDGPVGGDHAYFIFRNNTITIEDGVEFPTGLFLFLFRINVNGAVNYVEFSGNRIRNNGTFDKGNAARAIILETQNTGSAGFVRITNNSIENMSDFGWDGAARSLLAHGNIIFNSDRQGLLIANQPGGGITRNISVIGNIISNSWFSGIFLAGDPTLKPYVVVTGNESSNNNVSVASSDGLTITEAEVVTISNNQFFDDGTNTPAIQQQGVNIASSVDRVIFAGNWTGTAAGNADPDTNAAVATTTWADN